MSRFAAAFTCIIALVNAAPVYTGARHSRRQDAVVIGVGTNGNGTIDRSQVCALLDTQPDRRLQWDNSGASFFLNNFLNQNTDVNWARKLNFQGCDTPGNENLCQAPNVFDSKTCNQSPEDPPALFFIQEAVAVAHDFFDQTASALDIGSAIVSNRVDQIVSDFSESVDTNQFNIFNFLAGGLTVASGLAGESPIGPALDVLTGIFSIFGAQNEPSQPDPTAALKDQLNQVILTTHNAIETTLKTLFDGTQNGNDASNLPGIPPVGTNGPNGETQAVAKFFASGIWLDASAIPDPGASINQSVNALSQGIVAALLKQQNKFIFVDTTVTDESTCTSRSPAAAFVNNQCFQIIFQGEGTLVFEPTVLDATLAAKLADTSSQGYSFDFSAFYQNADACTAANPNFDGALSSSALTAADGGFPACYFNMPVLKGANTPCNAPNIGSLPSNFGFSSGDCSRATLGDPDTGNGNGVVRPPVGGPGRGQD